MVKAVPFLLLLPLALAGCGDKATEAKGKAADAGKGSSAEPAKPLLTKLEKTDTVPGKGPAASQGDLLYMKYRGTLPDGTEFDSTEAQGGKPFILVLGAGTVIPGWDQGLVGMKVGGKRRLGIPYELGYGADGSPPKIPPKTDLYFDVELLDIVKRGEEDIIDRTDLKVGTGRAAKKGDTVTVHYKATLVGGEEFDSSYLKKKPYSFEIGGNRVLPFFEVGVEGMKVGGKRRVRIPPAAGFGATGNQLVGPNEILFYEIELLSVK